MAKCRHCHKEIPDNANYCAYCATPTKPIEGEHRGKRCPKCKRTYFGRVYYCRWCKIVLGPETVIKEDSSYNMYCPQCGKMINSKDNYCMHCGKEFRGRKILNFIDREFNKSGNIEYCPRCNSRNIKLYRNGYNYKEGLWFSILGNARGGAFVAGLDANKARCRCLNCGKDWLTDYDYRLL